MKAVKDLLRKNIRDLIPYSAAREKYQGNGYTFLDANENPVGKFLNRYPDPYQKELIRRIARICNVSENMVFTGNGSDEAIDLVIRAFCNPEKDNIIVPLPTYGMYTVAANINAVEVRNPSLTENFQPEPDEIFRYVDEQTKLIFLNSPNNPTGNLFERSRVKEIIERFDGLVVLDEAYIDFSEDPGFLPDLKEFPNLIIMQTFSKARGLAGIRLGLAFADPEIIDVLKKIKFPYNVNSISQKVALKELDKSGRVKKLVRMINREKAELTRFLESCTFVERIYRSDANFILVKVTDPAGLVNFLAGRSVIIRDRSDVPGCEGSVRITIGKPSENKQLIKYCREFKNQP